MKTNEEMLVKNGFTKWISFTNGGKVFIRLSYPHIILRMFPDQTFVCSSLELRYLDYDKYIKPLIIDEGKENQ